MTTLWVTPLVAMAATAGLMPIVIRIAFRFGWFDEVNERKIHSGRVPRLGGVAVYMGLLLAGIVVTLLDHVSFAGPADYGLLFAGVTVFFVLGLVDDFVNVHGLMKLAVQVAGAILLVDGGARIPSELLSIMPEPVASCVVSGLSVGWIVFATNALNLSDGLDGLAGAVSLIGSAAVAAVALVSATYGPGLIALSLGGAIVGFLLFNLPPARVFMGDGGSLLIGATVSSLPLVVARNVEEPALSLVLVAPLVLAIPAADTLAAIVRRSAAGVPFWHADRRHFHHVLLEYGFTNRQILAVAGLVAAAFATLAIAMQPDVHPALWVAAVVPGVAGALTGVLIRRHLSVTRSPNPGSPFSTQPEEL